MKKGFHKILAIAMALLVLATTISFTIDAHYCGDTLVDVSLFHNASTCGMETIQQDSDCELPMAMDSCCSDKQFVLEGHDDLDKALKQLNIQQQTFVAIFYYTYNNLFEGLDENIVPFKDYHPPFLERDVRVLNQVFLI